MSNKPEENESKVEETKSEDKKPTSIAELLPRSEQEDEDNELFLKLMGPDGKLLLDESLPAEFELEIMANQALEAIAQVKQLNQTWRASRNSGDHAKAKIVFDQMNANKVLAAIIQVEFPKCKPIVAQLAEIRVKQAHKAREKLLKEED